MSKFKKLILTISSLATAFTFISCQNLETQIKLVNTYNENEVTIKMHEGYLEKSQWGVKIDTKAKLDNMIDSIIANFEKNYILNSQTKYENDNLIHNFEEKDLIFFETRNYDKLLNLNESKTDFMNYWANIKANYTEEFFAKNYILVNPKTINGNFGKDYNVDVEEYFRFYDNLSFDNKDVYIRLYYKYELEIEKLQPDSLNLQTFLSKNNVFYVYHYYEPLGIEKLEKTQDIPQPLKKLLKPGILFVDLSKDKIDQEFRIKEKYSLNEFIRAFNL